MNAAIKYVSTIRGTRDIFGTKNGRRHPFVFDHCTVRTGVDVKIGSQKDMQPYW
jgi:hypothetical protein